MHIRSHVTRNIIKRAASRFRFEGVFCSPSRKKHLSARLYAPLIELGAQRHTRAHKSLLRLGAARVSKEEERLINFNECAPLEGFD